MFAEDISQEMCMSRDGRDRIISIVAFIIDTAKKVVLNENQHGFLLHKA